MEFFLRKKSRGYRKTNIYKYIIIIIIILFFFFSNNEINKFYIRIEIDKHLKLYI